MEIPKGYKFAALSAGFRYKNRNDLAVLLSDQPAMAAGVFTTNRFQAAPVLVAQEIIAKEKLVRAVLINAGQANACTGDTGVANCRISLRLVAKELDLRAADILPASTGVIGDQLNMDAWQKVAPLVPEALKTGSPMDAAKAIMTTDAFPKLAWRMAKVKGVEVRVLGMAKGAGMICPNMATMLSFVVTDAAVDPAWWRDTIKAVADKTFNAITVDGDTSTNDCLIGLANGAAGIKAEGKAGREIARMVEEVCADLSYMIVQDAEGGTKVVRIKVVKAKTKADAEAVARTIGHSQLVKTAMFGQDPNWGRIVAAVGRSGASFDPNKVEVKLAGLTIFTEGRPVKMDRDAVFAPYLRRKEIEVEVNLSAGRVGYELLTSDLTLDYVRINAEYRT